MLPRLKEGVTQTPQEFLGDWIRAQLDSAASMWDIEADQAQGSDLSGPPVDMAVALVAYIRDPANVMYTVPAYVPPPDLTIPPPSPPV